MAWPGRRPGTAMVEGRTSGYTWKDLGWSYEKAKSGTVGGGLSSPGTGPGAALGWVIGSPCRGQGRP
jgi:hypothetical protein